jgi:hypothetical protein
MQQLDKKTVKQVSGGMPSGFRRIPPQPIPSPQSVPDPLGAPTPPQYPQPDTSQDPWAGAWHQQEQR